MTRLKLSALAGAAILATGFLAATIPAQARCVGIAACANAGGNRFATNPGLARPGASVAKPGPGFNGGGIIGQNGNNMLGGGARVIGHNGATFR